ncbi:MAG: heavy metal translocating P-type ATPase, partial [Clostridia bacterium]
MILQAFKANQYIILTVFVVGYVFIGYDILLRAVKNIIHGKVFDENFLMSIATIGAFVIGEYSEGIAVMIFYQVGEYFQRAAVAKSRKSIADLMDIRPDYANLKKGESIEKVDPFDVAIGDIIVIKPGEKIPLDCVVVDGVSTLNTAALTGESIPKDANIGTELLSGSLNINGVLTARVTKEFSESTASKILELVENATNNKSTSENFITKFAKYYTPIVVIIAVGLAIIPSLFDGNWSDWVYRALTFLVVSCPCALVISVPLSFFGGIGNASKKGVLIKGSNYLEALNNTEIVVFDKTGTLTKGVFKVQNINENGISKESLLDFTAHAESFSSHPISVSILKEYGKTIDKSRVNSIEEIAGYGIKAIVDQKEVLAGNSKLMKKFGIAFEENHNIGSVIYVAIDKKYVGNILIADEIKKEAKDAIAKL